MSSSTSGSRHEWKVVVTVLAVILAAETTLRALDRKLSLDIVHIRQIPTIMQEMMEGPRPRLLFLGNSLTRDGIRTDVFLEQMHRHGLEPLTVARAFPDNTQIGEWYYAFRKYAVDAGRIPDVLIIDCPTDQLADTAHYSIYGLASWWTSYRDLPEVFRNEVTVFGDRVEFLIAKHSIAFANRRRVNSRVLHALIPHYSTAARQINQVLRRTMQQAVEAEHIDVTYHRLERLIRLTRQHHVHLVIAAIPTESTYSIDPQLVELLDARGVTFFDCRDTPGIDRSHYRDGFHLNEQGAAIYTTCLADRLAPVLSDRLSEWHSRTGPPGKE